MMTREQIRDALDSRLPGCRLLQMDIDAGGLPAPSGDGEVNVRRHRLLITGEWGGHWQGAFAVNEGDLDRIVANARARGTDIPVDYEHGTVFSLFSAPGSTKASGWLDPQSLAVVETDTGHALDGTIRWTRPAAGAIREKEFRYLSPTIQWRTTDRFTGDDTGTSLHSVALTNTPFLTELPEVQLNSLAQALAEREAQTTEDEMDPKEIAALATALGLDHTASAQDMLDAARGMSEEVRGYEAVASVCGLSTGSVADVINHVTTLQAQRVDPAELERLRAAEVEAREARVNAAVDQAQRDGKLVAGQVEWARGYASDNLDAFNAWAASALKVVETEIKTPRPGSIDASAASEHDGDTAPESVVKSLATKLSAQDRKDMRAAGLDEDTFVRANYDELVAR